MIPLNIYTPEINSSGEKQVFAPGDVIDSKTFLMERVLSKDEGENCTMNYYGIKEA